MLLLSYRIYFTLRRGSGTPEIRVTDFRSDSDPANHNFFKQLVPVRYRIIRKVFGSGKRSGSATLPESKALIN